MQATITEITNHRTLLPEPATDGNQWDVRKKRGKEGTFAMDPQERRRLPLFVNTTLEKPGGCSFVVGLACDIMICGGIRRGQPLLGFLS
jgi:hypothetical protein